MGRIAKVQQLGKMARKQARNLRLKVKVDWQLTVFLAELSIPDKPRQVSPDPQQRTAASVAERGVQATAEN